ncbi:hypothetical protein BLNAU_18410 [Blattamonas nauphoetae]|uniref:Uncharacterized protein n=1 Tax=Blattamonas nauphoetae TaxID=2049346 RepID=A0ABQ9X4F9_9EUKA|nr:hypothetical protein BLNAU_18410 [Blattamonas nauphoetae]
MVPGSSPGFGQVRGGHGGNINHNSVNDWRLHLSEVGVTPHLQSTSDPRSASAELEAGQVLSSRVRRGAVGKLCCRGGGSDDPPLRAAVQNKRLKKA